MHDKQGLKEGYFCAKYKFRHVLKLVSLKNWCNTRIKQVDDNYRSIWRYGGTLEEKNLIRNYCDLNEYQSVLLTG